MGYAEDMELAQLNFFFGEGDTDFKTVNDTLGDFVGIIATGSYH